VKWIIDILLFRANRSIFGRYIITSPIPITIIIHGGAILIGGVILTGGEDSDSITTIIIINLFKFSKNNSGREKPFQKSPKHLAHPKAWIDRFIMVSYILIP
jgi:hypothetical protein